MLSGANCIKPNYRKRDVVNSFGILLPIVLISAGAIYSLQSVARGGVPFSDSFFLILALVVSAAFVGLLDDLLGSRVIGGLKGHFSQVRFGIMTTGTLKAAIGLSISIIVAAAISNSALMFLLNAAVITLSINAANLFDLRPARAIKVFTLAASATFAASVSAVLFWDLWGFIIPPVVGLLWGDIKEKSMIGDSGANALGAIIGLSFVLNLNWITNLVILVVLVALHLLSERYSISTFISRTPVLKQLDELGWKR